MRPQECELSVQLLHGGIAPWSKPTAGIQEYSGQYTKKWGSVQPIPTVLVTLLQFEPINVSS